jgi:ribose 5-phosphate isomerase RpiB
MLKRTYMGARLLHPWRIAEALSIGASVVGKLKAHKMVTLIISRNYKRQFQAAPFSNQMRVT